VQALALQPADVEPVLPRSAHPALETNDVDDYLNIALQLCFEKSQPGGAVFDEWAQPADDFLSSFPYAIGSRIAGLCGHICDLSGRSGKVIQKCKDQASLISWRCNTGSSWTGLCGDRQQFRKIVADKC
jgi:hypothetical protein